MINIIKKTVESIELESDMGVEVISYVTRRVVFEIPSHGDLDEVKESAVQRKGIRSPVNLRQE